jgi:hypothetical protein
LFDRKQGGDDADAKFEFHEMHRLVPPRSMSVGGGWREGKAGNEPSVGRAA